MSTSSKTLSNRSTFDDALYNAAQDRKTNFLGKKIAEGRISLGMSLSNLSDVLQNYGVTVSKSAINKWEVGINVPNAYQLMALGQALHVEEDMGFFMSSSQHSQLNKEGIDKLRGYRDDLIASGRYTPIRYNSNVIQFREMPVSNLSASAGVGEFLDEGNFEMVSFPESSIPPKAEFAIRVSGDSMEPVYQNGQYVWVQKCNQLSVGEVGIFIYDGDGYIKVYNEQTPFEADTECFTDSYGVLHKQPVLVSYNKKYNPKVISALTNFQIVGRVLN